MQSAGFKLLVTSKAKSWKMLSLLQLLLAAQQLAWCSPFCIWSQQNYERLPSKQYYKIVSKRKISQQTLYSPFTTRHAICSQSVLNKSSSSIKQNAPQRQEYLPLSHSHKDSTQFFLCARVCVRAPLGGKEKLFTIFIILGTSWCVRTFL